MSAAAGMRRGESFLVLFFKKELFFEKRSKNFYSLGRVQRQAGA